MIDATIITVSYPIMTAVRAVGQVRTYEILLGSLQLGVLFLSWLVVRAGFPAYFIYLVAATVSAIMFFVRLWLTARLTGMPIIRFFRLVFVPVSMVAVASTGAILVVMQFFPTSMEAGFQSTMLVTIGAALLLPLICAGVLGLSRKRGHPRGASSCNGLEGTRLNHEDTCFRRDRCDRRAARRCAA
nr:hypothetical protein [Marinicella sp. W31]MDC2875955.1 hypothetical protein [Marinicella sp. W31]